MRSDDFARLRDHLIAVFHPLGRILQELGLLRPARKIKLPPVKHLSRLLLAGCMLGLTQGFTINQGESASWGKDVPAVQTQTIQYPEFPFSARPVSTHPQALDPASLHFNTFSAAPVQWTEWSRNGDYAYVASGPVLAALDVSDPAHPALAGFALLEEDIVQFKVAGSRAYVALLMSGMRAVDLTDPANPQPIALQVPPPDLGADTLLHIGGMAVAGETVYLAGYACYFLTAAVGECGAVVRVLDFSDPAQPVLLGGDGLGATSSVGWPMGLAYQEPYLYITSVVGDIHVLDVSSPSSISEVGYLDLPGETYGIAVPRVEYAVIVTGEDGLRTIDISQPEQPLDLGTAHNLSSAARQIDLMGVLGLVADGNAGLRLFDLTDPTQPVQVGSLDTPGNTWQVAAGPGLALLADDSGGLRLIDLTDAYQPVEVAAWQAAAQVTDLDAIVADQNALYLGGADGLRVLEPLVIGPQVPAQQAFLPPSFGPLQALALQDDRLLVAAAASGGVLGGTLGILDVSQPNSPQVLGSAALNGWPSLMHAEGNQTYLYLASGTDLDPGTLAVYDWSVPAEPQLQASLPLSSTIDLDYAGGYLYAAVLRDLWVFDVSDPQHPRLVSTYRPETDEFMLYRGLDEVAVGGGYAFMLYTLCPPSPHGYCERYLAVADARDSSHLVTLDNRYLADASDIAVQAEQLYVLYDDRLAIYPFEALPDLQPEAEIGLPRGMKRRLHISGNQIYVLGDQLLALCQGDLCPVELRGAVVQPNGKTFSGVTLNTSYGWMTRAYGDRGYSFKNMPPGEHLIIPSRPGFVFLPSARISVLPQDATGQSFLVLPEPHAFSLLPGVTYTHTFTDTQDLVTSLQFPQAAVAVTTTLRLTPTVASAFPGWAFAGHAFELAAYADDDLQLELSFGAPVMVSIPTSPADLCQVAEPAGVQLLTWIESGWQAPDSSCAGEWEDAANSAIDPLPEEAYLVCRTGRYALFGPAQLVHFPQIPQGAP